jgi:hypothetical protein
VTRTAAAAAAAADDVLVHAFSAAVIAAHMHTGASGCMYSGVALKTAAI